MGKDLEFWIIESLKCELKCARKAVEIKELKSENENLKNEISELKQLLKSKENQNKISELESKLSKAHSEIQEWHDEAIAIRNERDEMLANFRKGIEPYVDLRDMHDKIAELESQNENLKNEIAELEQHLKSKENLYEDEEIPFADEQYEEDLLAELQDRHQQDCIEINRLNTVIDVLIDKHSRLRQQIGL